MARTAVIITQAHHGMPVGTVGWINEKEPRSGSNHNFYMFSTGNKYHLDMVAGEFVAKIPSDKLQHSEVIAGVIAEKQRELNVLRHIYETGEIPPDEATKKQAQSILEAAKAIKAGDDEAATAALIKAIAAKM